MNTIYWIRHGQSVANTYKYLHSIIMDPVLTEKGKDDMIVVGRALLDKQIQLIICSPLIRSIESAYILQNYIMSHSHSETPDILILPSLREKGWGLDNFAVSSLVDSNPRKIIKNLWRHSQFRSFYSELFTQLDKYDTIAIVGHDKINLDFIKKITGQDFSPMKNGDIIKVGLSNDGTAISVENYLRR